MSVTKVQLVSNIVGNVSGGASFTGIVTASSFSGNASSATYTSEWILGAFGTNDYTFTGPGFTGAENDPVLYLVRGQQYKFTNTMGAHPFRIQSTVNGSTGTQYNDGITNNDVSNGTLTWNVQFDAPSLLYYQCTTHSGMGGKIYIVDAGIGTDVSINTTGIITAASFVGNVVGTATGLSGTPNLNVGVVTASSFVGNVTGTATGLSGSPNVTVGNITGLAATFTNLTVNGTQTIINTTELNIADKTVGIASTSTPSDALADGAGIVVYGTTNKTLLYDNTRKGWDFNIPLTTDEVRFYSVAEKHTTIDGNTASLVYSANGSNIGLCTNPTGNITLAVTGIPTTSDFDNHTLTFSVFVNQTGTARSCTSVTLNGFNATIRWAGGSLGNATSGVTTSNGMDIYSFTGINTVGSASTTANYYVLGVVNGGYR